MAGNKNSGREDMFSEIRKAYLKADPSVPIYELGLDKKYIDILERWIFIDMVRSKDYPRKNTKEILHLWKRKYGLSDQQFFNDKKNCERLFGGLVEINKEYEKKLAVDSYDAIFSMAMARGDLKSAIEAMKNKCLLIGINEKSEIDPSGTGAKNYIMTTNIVLDSKVIAQKNINISDIQSMDLNELKELSKAIDTPDASMDYMEAEIEKLDE
jgi:hypothetical protein